MTQCTCCGEDSPCAGKISIFRHLDEESLEEISRIAVHRSIKKGEILFSPQTSHGLYLISQGRVKVYELTPSGREYLLRVLHQGDFVGEEALFADAESYTFGQALSDGKVCFIGRQEFLELLTRHPSISLKLLEEFSRRMSHAAHQTATNTEPVKARLKEYLQTLSAAQDSPKVTIPLPLKELSAYNKLMGIVQDNGDFLSKIITKLDNAFFTDMTVSQLQDLVKDLSQCTFEPFLTIQGEATKGEEFMEFYPDEDSLNAVIRELFYQ